MMRNKNFSSLQKTYDECYLICSTAVYFESQGNESEALRSWRSALDQIYFFNARTPADLRPRSETEKALKDSLRDMELQCKERVELLEALSVSRGDKASADEGAGVGSSSQQSSTANKLSKSPITPRPSNESEAPVRGFIGDGTIPAMSYPDLSRPARPTPSPRPRPPVPPRNISDRAVVGRNSSSTTVSSDTAINAAQAQVPSSGPDSLVPPKKVSKKTSRSRSPQKERSMLTTLRFNKGEKRPTKPARVSSNTTDDTVTSKAATLAWNALRKKPSPKDDGGRTHALGVAASATALDSSRKQGTAERPSSDNQEVYYNSHSRRLVTGRPKSNSPPESTTRGESYSTGDGPEYPFPSTNPQQQAAGSEPMLNFPTVSEIQNLPPIAPSSDPETTSRFKFRTPPPVPPAKPAKFDAPSYPTYLREYPETTAKKNAVESRTMLPLRRRSPAKPRTSGEERNPEANGSSSRKDARHVGRTSLDDDSSSPSYDERSGRPRRPRRKIPKQKEKEDAILADADAPKVEESDDSADRQEQDDWAKKVKYMMKHLPKGCDELAAKQIFNEIVVKGDEVHWDDVAGLDAAKNALKEAVVYPFLRPDLFMGLREPARGMLLFGPPGTGKTMLARAVATESRSTFFSISASSLTSKYLGESEKLVRALFALAKYLAPSIIFVDEIDSLLSSRAGAGEHEATRRIKTEFLIQWSDLQRAAAGREQTDKEKDAGDPTRVLVLAATNMPWLIDDAARRRFVRRQYIPLPEGDTRAVQLANLLGHQKHNLSVEDIQKLVMITEGFSGSDITALAKDAAMGPLRSLGEALLHMPMDQIRPFQFEDFMASLVNIRPSVSQQGLMEYEAWAKEFGERGG
ncbi:hypothetical protein VE01_09422 [Pseudogymnoascus verrucosus]|uniref:AAA+ ATPase domain-containing protein n=1 Tax=Pseudogymnoascus verrucosus TaxID=342668 RepID=A0A1B8G971_9PEZI|nr:uncharacterized protein VE01_09422 [Pseudogymnoascus verrucosus]OBT92367.1 hypothetical protein VE01_09422 [Pseudogymnoascus verrucosus]